jgi:hypothetical protein
MCSRTTAMLVGAQRPVTANDGEGGDPQGDGPVPVPVPTCETRCLGSDMPQMAQVPRHDRAAAAPCRRSPSLARRGDPRVVPRSMANWRCPCRRHCCAEALRSLVSRPRGWERQRPCLNMSWALCNLWRAATLPLRPLDIQSQNICERNFLTDQFHRLLRLSPTRTTVASRSPSSSARSHPQGHPLGRMVAQFRDLVSTSPFLYHHARRDPSFKLNYPSSPPDTSQSRLPWTAL